MALADRITITNVRARRYLRVDDAEEDEIIEPMIQGAAERAEQYIGHDFDPDPVPQLVEAAILRILASLYEWRDDETEVERLGDENRTRADTEMPGSAERLLYPYRKNPGF